MIGLIKSLLEQHLKFFSLSASDDLQNLWWRQLLVNCFWRGASDDVRLSSELFLVAEASFLLIPLLLFVLQNLYLKLKTLNFLSMSCTLEQILAYPIDTFDLHNRNQKQIRKVLKCRNIFRIVQNKYKYFLKYKHYIRNIPQLIL